MTGSRSVQALKLSAATLLVLCAFAACSSDEGAAPNPFTDPPTLEISAISLGSGSIGQGGDSGVLACDDALGITLALSNWRLEPPGKCGSTPQCGQIRVSLLGAGNGVGKSRHERNEMRPFHTAPPASSPVLAPIQ